jgi:hypothetical protein
MPSAPASTVAATHIAANTTAFPNGSLAVSPGRVHAATTIADTRPATPATHPAAGFSALLTTRQAPPFYL